MGFTRRLPTPLGQRIASASGALYSRQGREFDLAIGGIPFMLATTNEIPQSIETIKVRKDQFDTEDPGEQSLTGWWRRSQASFHEGAGNLYQETTFANTLRPIASNAFYDSAGVDVFTQGKLTLLKKMKQGTGAAAQYTRIRSYAINSTRTNLCTNPGAETDVTGWTVNATAPDAATVARSTTRAHSGTASVLATFTNDDGTGFPPIIRMPAMTTVNGQTYTVSAYVYVPTGTVDIKIAASGNGFGTSTSLKDQWVRLQHTFTASGTTTYIEFWPNTPAGAGTTFYIDDVLFESGTVLGDYFDGSYPNCAWTGVANDSTSTQTISSASASFSAVGDGALHTSSAVSGSYSALHSVVGKTIIDGLISGSYFYDVASDGTLYQGLTSSPGTATSWPCGGTPTRLAWGKQRLWVAGGRSIWQPNLSAAGGSSQSPIFTNPNQGWNYTCIAEGPSAMYFGGHDGFASSIQAVTFDAGGGIPTLSGATVTAVLPDGELIQELAVVAGQFIAIGTNRGVRVGIINTTDASITYGPLLVEPDGVIACSAITAQNRFFVVAFRTSAGNALAYRVDTSTELSQDNGASITFPYASDIDLGFTGAITSLVAASTTQLAATASDGKVYYQSTTEYVSDGWLQTGRIRYRTTEPKSFRFVTIGIEPLNGNVAVSLVKSDGSAFPLGSLTKQGDINTDQFFYDGDPMEFASVKVELTPTADGLAAPVVNSILLRALPAVRPQRLITLPLLCYDTEQSRSGQRYGGDGFAKDRLTAMTTLEDASTVLTLQDFVGGYGNHQVVIESLKFVQTTPPRGGKGRGGTGGILLVELRTVDV